jgi:hypothetical protein
MAARYENHLDLHELYCGLFRNLDERKLASLADQYHADVVVRMFFSRQQREANEPSFITTGCDQIIAEMTSFFTQVNATHHMLSNFVTDVAGDEASVKSLLRAYHRGTSKVDGLFEESLATFDSKARKDASGDWKVTELNYTVLIMLGSPAVFGETFPEA